MVLCETSVRERAYYIWEGEGRIFGRAEAHWLQAEAELRQAAIADSSTVAEPVKVAKPRASRAKSAVKAPAEVLAGVAKAAKAPSKAAAKSAEKPLAKAKSKSKPATNRAKSQGPAQAAVLH